MGLHFGEDVDMVCQGRMQPTGFLEKDVHIGAALKEERQLLGEMIADGVARPPVVGDQTDAHAEPFLSSFSVRKGYRER